MNQNYFFHSDGGKKVSSTNVPIFLQLKLDFFSDLGMFAFLHSNNKLRESLRENRFFPLH